MSLHTYVAQSSFFAILAPTQRHKSDGRLMGYNSWRRRGWCQPGTPKSVGSIDVGVFGLGLAWGGEETHRVFGAFCERMLGL